jgi:uncharacterized cupin superfamily protein
MLAQPAMMAVTAPSTAKLSPAGVRAGYDSGRPEVSLCPLYSSDGVESGIWQCTPGGWTIKNRPNTEVCYIVSGAGMITDQDGRVHTIGAGTVVTLPRGWSGRWDITQDLRKVYVFSF